MHISIAGGTGLIGQRLVNHWLQQGHEITVIGRTRLRVNSAFKKSVSAVTWEQLSPEILSSSDLIINLAGANVGERRWSDARKKEILQSRIGITAKLVEQLVSLGEFAPPLMNASAIGFYGLQESVKDGLPSPLTEDMVGDENSTDFLSEVGRKWEAAAKPFIAAGGRVIFLRFGVVFASEGGALPKMVTPFRFGVGGPIGSGRQPVSWVAIDDVVKAIEFLKNDPAASGPYNIVAPECVSQKQLAKAIGKQLHRPSFVPLPAFMVRVLFGQMGEELLLSGQHVRPARLIERGFQFDYPKLDQALTHLL